ncbi:MAG TPA: DUF896 domain-containing protein [Candidatus Limiplasma sp.]|nr:DUF896 domain-containing protein [Candidatus Limiplasma sp.]HRX09913.1 DUF896 domain-containing protein [Candidatus Limiplasma sp.]
MDKAKIDRINELARIKKERGLSAEELNEQTALRREYIDEFKQNVHATLKNVRIQNKDGSLSELQRKQEKE